MRIVIAHGTANARMTRGMWDGRVSGERAESREKGAGGNAAEMSKVESNRCHGNDSSRKDDSLLDQVRVFVAAIRIDESLGVEPEQDVRVIIDDGGGENPIWLNVEPMDMQPLDHGEISSFCGHGMQLKCIVASRTMGCIAVQQLAAIEMWRFLGCSEIERESTLAGRSSGSDEIPVGDVGERPDGNGSSPVSIAMNDSAFQSNVHGQLTESAREGEDGGESREIQEPEDVHDEFRSEFNLGCRDDGDCSPRSISTASAFVHRLRNDDVDLSRRPMEQELDARHGCNRQNRGKWNKEGRGRVKMEQSVQIQIQIGKSA